MKKMTNRPTYSLGSSGWDSPVQTAKEDQQRKRSLQHRRKSSDDFSADGNASLTYSAASSVNSGGSAAGESNDSSFADVMRVLDLQDSWELKEFIRKEGTSSITELRSRRLSSGQSMASSLAYSTDGESHLEGTKLLQTITGQSNDGYGFDGASAGQKDEPIEGDMGLMFAPAEPGRIKKKKRNKNKSKEPSSSPGTASNEAAGAATTVDPSSANTTPQSKRSHQPSYRDASPSPSVDTPTKSPPSEKATPPPHPKRRYHIEDAGEDDEIWYAKWWMFCFADGIKMMPKR